jgi:16S rRNA (adenine1518-N6/adenine1519-N6)-dimethyltransferase
VGRAPDTPSAVRAALAAAGLAPLKRYGQNFLVDPRVLDRAAAAAQLRPGDAALEVGPGLGALTERLLATGARVVAVEIDRGLAEGLRRTFADEPRFTLIEGDVLAGGRALNPGVVAAVDAARAECGGAWSVAANLPYGVTSPFLLALLDAVAVPPRRATVMVQKEVGDVLAAAPGSPDYSTLSLAARVYWRVARVLVAGPEAFYPRPEVESCVMTLDPREGDAPPPAAFLDFVRALFQSRRKTLRSSLRRVLGDPSRADAALAAAGLDPADRVDGADPARIVALFRAVQ